MSEQNPVEQLDSFVEAILAGRELEPAPEGNGVQVLARLAAELRDLPRGEFRESLGKELLRRATMTATSAAARQKVEEPVRHTITPYLAVREAEGLIEFVQKAFGARGKVHGIGSQGGLH